MKCPLCNVELRIKVSRMLLENDDTPDVPTKLYAEHQMTCLNKNCANYETTVDTIRNEIQLDISDEEAAE